MRLTDITTNALLTEGVRIGKKELQLTLEHSEKIRIGIEYEVYLPNIKDDEYESSDRKINRFEEIIQKYNIPEISKVVPEHDDMIEIITSTMPLEMGISHIKSMFNIFNKEGIKVPSTAGMHVSISHEDYAAKRINMAKFMVLLSAGYLHSIFPEREYVESIEHIISRIVHKHKPTDVEGFEGLLDWSLQEKRITAKISDFFDMKGRIELRFIGGENYHERYEEIKWQVLRAVYIMEIAFDENMYRKEYLKKVASYLQKPNPPTDPKWYANLTPEDAIKYSYRYGRVDALEDIIATDAEESYRYAQLVLGAKRFEKGEDVIATDVRFSYGYAKHCLRGRFPKGEDIMSQSATFAHRYATLVLEDRFPIGEPAIATNRSLSLSYIEQLIDDTGPMPELEEGLIDNGYVPTLVAYYVHLSGTEHEVPYREEFVDMLVGTADADLAFQYVQVFNRPIPELESAIALDSKASLQYAENILKERFPAGEEIIAENPADALMYAVKVIKGRFEEAEDYIADMDVYAFLYARDAIKGRFEKGEAAIKQDEDLWSEYQEKIVGKQ